MTHVIAMLVVWINLHKYLSEQYNSIIVTSQAYQIRQPGGVEDDQIYYTLVIYHVS